MTQNRSSTMCECLVKGKSLQELDVVVFFKIVLLYSTYVKFMVNTSSRAPHKHYEHEKVL